MSSWLPGMVFCLGSLSEVCWLVVCGTAAVGDYQTEFVGSFVDLAHKVECLYSYFFWVCGMVFLSPFIYHLFVLALVQELVGSFCDFIRGVMVQLFVCGLIHQEPSAFFDVFQGVHHH